MDDNWGLPYVRKPPWDFHVHFIPLVFLGGTGAVGTTLVRTRSTYAASFASRSGSLSIVIINHGTLIWA